MREITGTMVAYSYLCSRKLWLFANEITLEDESENVAIGKLIDEETYSREDKHIMVDGVANIDFIRHNVVYEVKKSDAQLEMAENQVKYYLYLLRKRGVDISEGLINVPSKKATYPVKFDQADEEKIEARLEDINKIIFSDQVPPIPAKAPCKKCAYYEYCYI